ncbi:hypothetical protein [Nocardioides sp.]|uniref:hypothetical protein n=1 Tax=Nocardioides sp. TaxID=35761 RepID=UPI00356780E8
MISDELTRRPPSPWPAPILVGCLLTLAVSLTWTYLSMRAVMDVGGSCAQGGPYAIETPCPDGAVLISIAIPIMLLATFAGTFAAVPLKAPNLLAPMWAILFGALGWNFLEYAVAGESLVIGWLVCGVVFWAMALPALAAMVAGVRSSLLKPDRGSAWLAVYLVAGVIGSGVGWWSFNAVS